MANQTISEALKNLFIELGGDPTKLTDNQKVSDYIDDLATVLSGAPEEFVITITQEDEKYVSDKTAREIAAALEAGKKLVVSPQFNNFNLSGNGKISLSSVAAYSLGFVGTLYGGSDDDYLIALYLSLNTEENSIIFDIAYTQIYKLASL